MMMIGLGVVENGEEALMGQICTVVTALVASVDGIVMDMVVAEAIQVPMVMSGPHHIHLKAQRPAGATGTEEEEEVIKQPTILGVEAMNHHEGMSHGVKGMTVIVAMGRPLVVALIPMMASTTFDSRARALSHLN